MALNAAFRSRMEAGGAAAIANGRRMQIGNHGT
jgi:hypothetical protein